jgi:MFS family permease
MDQSEVPDKLFITELSVVGSQESQSARENERITERQLLWKIDLRILPILTILYIFSAMDRSDIGNAQVAGMQKDIGASSQQWTLVAALFYLGYIISQPFATLSMRRLNPPNLFAFACCLWGVLTILLLTTKNYQQATGIRVCIGLAEGLLQAAPLYLSLWYKVTELGTRGAIFFSVSSLAGACNGLIAYGLENNFSNSPPFKPWQWLFLIEGIMSVGFSLIVWLLLPPVPERVRLGFTVEEKRIAIARSVQAFNTLDAKINKSHIGAVFKQPFIYFMIIAYSGTIIGMSSLTNFMPSIIQGMGYSSVNAQLMTGTNTNSS